MPHLSQLQRDYKDKNFTIIGMTAGDRNNPLEAVQAMVKKKGDGMDYTVAFDVERKTYESWMSAAGQRGIPTSFLVDKSGKIAWIGHPANVDIPLAKVVEGTWDYEKGPAMMKRIYEARDKIYEAASIEPKRALELLEKFRTEYPMAAKGLDSLHFKILAGIPEQMEAATKLGTKLVEKAIAAKDPMALNQFAWNLVDPEVKSENRFLDLALRAANKASELTEEKDAATLDTVARCYYWKGDLEMALKTQKRAVEHAEGEMKSQLEPVVREYEKALKAKKKAG
ncbi:MAG: TlpA family protein disulfide reductase [bacterium]|nr:TlpA family protein disulfide reductase [bacterium]